MLNFVAKFLISSDGLHEASMHVTGDVDPRRTVQELEEPILPVIPLHQLAKQSMG